MQALQVEKGLYRNVKVTVTTPMRKVFASEAKKYEHSIRLQQRWIQPTRERGTGAASGKAAQNLQAVQNVFRKLKTNEAEEVSLRCSW